jgi:phage shock protein PspC (stress-responsive transcriptional regulator)
MIPMVEVGRWEHDRVMSTYLEADHTEPDPPQDAPHPRRLLRCTSDRMLGGVACGIADYLGIDPSIVRIGFVILAFIGGLGIVLYMAGWLLMPEEGAESDGAAEGTTDPGSRRSVLVVLAILGALFVAFALTPWWRSIAWYPGIGWLILGSAAVVLLTRRSPRPTLRRLFTWTAVAALSLVLLAVTVVLSAVALSGVPIRGGIGDHQWRPTSMAGLQRSYRTAVGDSTLDLRQVRFTGTTRIAASVGIGHLLVQVPPGVVVSLDTHAGIGDVTYGPGGSHAFFAAATAPTSAPAGHLALTADVGIGQVELVRAAPGSSGVATETIPAKPAPAPPAAPPTA